MGATAETKSLSGEEACARRYARQLLSDTESPGFASIDDGAELRLVDEHPATTWAQSGLMSLTGRVDGDPLMCPVPVTACADGALAALNAVAGEGPAEQRGSQLLVARAAIAGYSRRGRTSPGGSCRLLDAADGRIAVNLARDVDWELLPAWLEQDIAQNWDALELVIKGMPLAGLVERGRLVGLAIAESCLPGGERPAWFSVISSADSSPPVPAPLVVDLSSLWAGPLCSQLLRERGADVIKVESAHRPDGARSGPAAFFDLLNAGKKSVALDLDSVEGQGQLRELLLKADIVIEGSRPRALRQLGIHAEEILAHSAGKTWISLTGHGRTPSRENWIAYGDDAAVAAGLSEVMNVAVREPCIVGDAIADPLTGVHAALVAALSWRSGGGRLISLSMRDVVANCIAFEAVQGEALRHRAVDWNSRVAAVQLPAAPGVTAIARSIGADNAAVLA